MALARLFALAALAFFGFATAAATRLAFRESKDVDPLPGEASIERGLAAERAGRFEEAERELLEGARLDHQYLPAWTLANYYFRRGQSGSFWPWAARSAALSHGDLGPLLKLSEGMASDPAAALERLQGSPRVERAYLDFLIGEDRLDAAQAVGRRMLARHSPEETPRLLDLVNRQIRAGHGADALEIWNGLGRFPRLDPAAGRLLTNGDLSTEPGGEGFDWRLPAVEGLTTRWRASRIEFAFSGSQPEACTLLEQALPSGRTGKRYRLIFEYSASGMPRPSGVHWMLDREEGPALEASEGWRTGEWIVTLHALTHLRLVYRREPGTVRAEGRVELRSLRLNTL